MHVGEINTGFLEETRTWCNYSLYLGKLGKYLFYKYLFNLFNVGWHKKIECIEIILLKIISLTCNQFDNLILPGIWRVKIRRKEQRNLNFLLVISLETKWLKGLR